VLIKAADIRFRIFFVLLVALYKLLLNGFYFQLSNYFDYYGLILEPRMVGDRFLIWLSLLLVAFFTPVQVKKASTALHGFLFLFCMIPASVYAELNKGHQLVFFFGLLAAFLATPFLRDMLSLSKGLRFVALNRKAFIFTFGALVAILGLGLVSSFGLKLSIPTVATVYDQREVFHANAGRIDKYFFDWFVHSINVLLMISALRYRNFILFGLSLMLTLYLFSLGGHKGALLLGPFTLAIYLTYYFVRERFLLAFATLMVMVISIGFVYDRMLGLNFSPFSSILIRRGLLLPSQIYYHYCDFFSTHELNYFSQNVPFKFFLNSPYDKNLPYIIGDNYFSFNDGNYANGNVFADAFANIGFAAYPVAALFLSLFYSVADWLSSKKDLLIALPLIFISAHTFINTGFIVALITHGLALSVLLLFLYPNLPHGRSMEQ
jgi:hypothetical protein